MKTKSSIPSTLECLKAVITLLFLSLSLSFGLSFGGCAGYYYWNWFITMF